MLIRKNHRQADFEEWAAFKKRKPGATCSALVGEFGRMIKCGSVLQLLNRCQYFRHMAVDLHCTPLLHEQALLIDEKS